MSDTEKILSQILVEIRALKFPLDLIEKLRILSDLLQGAIVKQTNTNADLRQLLGDVHHDLAWLRKHVAELNKLLSAVIAHDPEER